MAWLGIEPWIDPFRSDPRYALLLRDIGLPHTPASVPLAFLSVLRIQVASVEVLLSLLRLPK